jgi:Ca-activated chloride channel family protein
MLALSQIVPHETLDRTNDLRQPERRTPSMNTPSMKRMAWSVPSPTPTEPSSAILLLTDGQNTDGVSPDDAAAAAAAHGVRVFAVGFGTEKGVVPGAGMSTVRVPMNEHMLRTIAEQTRAEYFHASTGSELQEIYRKVEGRLSSANRPTEVTALFAVVAALVVAVSGLASLAWFGRIV